MNNPNINIGLHCSASAVQHKEGLASASECAFFGCEQPQTPYFPSVAGNSLSRGAMRVAVASGKGGTGKTTVATNLAHVASTGALRVGFVDCDVEEPNAALFLKPEILHTKPASVAVPKVDVSKCNACGLCGQICQFGAIVVINEKVLTFPDLCHGCGGCWRVCTSGAVTETSRQIGRIDVGRSGQIHFAQGELNIGEVLSPPVIRQAKEAIAPVDLLIIDAPPGTACPVVESVRDVDYVVLVTEPTPFGLHDLKLAVDMLCAIQVPFGVVINRAGSNDRETENFCFAHDIRILASIPDDRRIAELNSQGLMVCDAIPEYGTAFKKLLDSLAGVAEPTS
ncbi:P-loop NTPase [Teredinibacter haidensis]|uniref:P-loop NTPase n=1 Tax=Teredinibacter haidensis TaxID=2731755 RepID=UPI000ABE87E5|nr:ATP-binding protein [Teredinibacter haidensis]